MLDSLEKKGFITRKTDERSRRSNLVEITEKGLQAYKEWRRHCRETEAIMLQGFDAAEKEQFAEFLRRAYQNFQRDKEPAVQEDPGLTGKKGGESSCGI